MEKTNIACAKAQGAEASANEIINLNGGVQYATTAEVKSAFLTVLEKCQEMIDAEVEEGEEINIYDYYNADELVEVVREINNSNDNYWCDNFKVFKDFDYPDLEEEVKAEIASVVLDFLPDGWHYNSITENGVEFYDSEEWVYCNGELHSVENEHLTYLPERWVQGSIKEVIEYQLDYLSELLEAEEVYKTYCEICDYEEENSDEQYPYYKFNPYIFKEAVEKTLDLDAFIDFILPDIYDDLPFEVMCSFKDELNAAIRMSKVDIFDRDKVTRYFEKWKSEHEEEEWDNEEDE